MNPALKLFKVFGDRSDIFYHDYPLSRRDNIVTLSMGDINLGKVGMEVPNIPKDSTHCGMDNLDLRWTYKVSREILAERFLKLLALSKESLDIALEASWCVEWHSSPPFLGVGIYMELL